MRYGRHSKNRFSHRAVIEFYQQMIRFKKTKNVFAMMQ